MSVSEAAAFLRVDARTVRRMCERGELPAFHVGRQWRIDTTGAVAAPAEHTRGTRYGLRERRQEAAA